MVYPRTSSPVSWPVSFVRGMTAGGTRAVMLLALLTFTGVTPVRAQGPDAATRAWNQARLAWDAGDYIAALEGFERLLESANAPRFLEQIALLTGEKHPVREITTDGRRARISPDGRFVVYEATTAQETRLHLADLESTAAPRILEGTGFAFSPDGRWGVMMHVSETAAIRRARTALEQASREDRARLQAALRWEEAIASSPVLVELATGRTTAVATSGLVVAAATFGGNSDSILLTAAATGGNGHTAIYRVSRDARGRFGTPVRLTDHPISTHTPIDAAQGHLVYRTSTRSPLPAAPGAPAPAPAGRPGAGPGQLVVHHQASGRTMSFETTSVVLSADGTRLAWIERDQNTYRLVTVKVGTQTPVVLFETDQSVTAPALSPDGRLVAFQMMPWYDWEIYLSSTSAPGEPVRLTREIQHDITPRFLDNQTVLGLMGEGRHRRSHIYDVPTLSREKLFHNNTVRTIAPEYEWDASADGLRIVIVADRDGDTISPERGVYVVDRTRLIGRGDVLARIRGNLASERDLHALATRMYAPITAQVRAVTERVSITCLYEYQAAMFDFDSKYITLPGNALATEYLFETLRSFGYQPEYEWFEVVRGGQTLRIANVVATLEGTENPELIYLLTSHFDSNQSGPGADDNSTGIAVLLETARVLARHPLPATVRFVAFNGEEAGLLGSRAYARQASERGDRVAGAVNNDMIGWTRHHRLDNTIRYSNAGIRDVQHAGALLYSNLITYDAHYYRGTDAAALYEVWGDIIGGFGSYPVLGNPHYHRPSDLLETINHPLVTETTRATTAGMMLLASSPSRLTGLNVVSRRGTTVELAWDASPEMGITGYRVIWHDGNREQSRVVTGPALRLEGVRSGTTVAVRAVHTSGLEGWDWARLTLP